MAVTIELPSDIEAGLTAQAQAHGLELPQYVERLLREQVPPRAAQTLSPAERAAAWRESARGLPLTLPLSDVAISRESIYGKVDEYPGRDLENPTAAFSEGWGCAIRTA